MTKGRSELRIPEDILDLGAVSVPVLDGGRLVPCGHIQVGDDTSVMSNAGRRRTRWPG